MFAERIEAMNLPNEIREAIIAVRAIDPEVTTAVFTANGTWLYLTDDGDLPAFNNTIPEDVLDAASNAAYLDKGFPCAYYLPLKD